MIIVWLFLFQQWRCPAPPSVPAPLSVPSQVLEHVGVVQVLPVLHQLPVGRGEHALAVVPVAAVPELAPEVQLRAGHVAALHQVVGSGGGGRGGRRGRHGGGPPGKGAGRERRVALDAPGEHHHDVPGAEREVRGQRPVQVVVAVGPPQRGRPQPGQHAHPVRPGRRPGGRRLLAGVSSGALGRGGGRGGHRQTVAADLVVRALQPVAGVPHVAVLVQQVVVAIGGAAVRDVRLAHRVALHPVQQVVRAEHLLLPCVGPPALQDAAESYLGQIRVRQPIDLAGDGVLLHHGLVGVVELERVVRAQGDVHPVGVELGEGVLDQRQEERVVAQRGDGHAHLCEIVEVGQNLALVAHDPVVDGVRQEEGRRHVVHLAGLARVGAPGEGPPPAGAPQLVQRVQVRPRVVQEPRVGEPLGRGPGRAALRRRRRRLAELVEGGLVVHAVEPNHVLQERRQRRVA
mmetsp:Transcript_28484/g.49377  ORF Transcript_28484/g.49377 Transcript_28484/m.49377 type:complete len:458 (+) Transcript_28484:197-1570(+)